MPRTPSHPERTVCIHVDTDGTGQVIWSDPATDPDLDELIVYLIEEDEVTGPGVYILLGLQMTDDEDAPIAVDEFALYTVKQHPVDGLSMEYGIETPKPPRLTTWPPKS